MELFYTNKLINFLIHRQRLRQIPRKIGIKPAHHAHVIRKQLQRQHSQQRADLRI